MIYAKIENGVVSNIIVAEPDVVSAMDGEWVDATGGWMGAAYIDGQFRQPIPSSVSPRQIRQALTAAGLRAGVEAAVATGDQDLKDWWEFATAFERGHPMVIGMSTGLGVTEQQLDELFVVAGGL